MNRLPVYHSLSRFIVAFTLCGYGFASAYGQLSRAGSPMPLVYEGAPGLQIYTLPVSEAQKIQALAADTSMLKPAKSGLLIDVSYSPDNSGAWDTLPNGTSIWRAAFRVADASQMNVLFSPYQVNRGVKVYLYDLSGKHVLGAFTDLNNKSFNRLSTAAVPGGLIIVELQVPGYLKSAGNFVISGVGCDFAVKPHVKNTLDEWYGTSAGCNVDINCNLDSLTQVVKNAVVRIVFEGMERCTGTLLNNTRKDGLQYLITAEHCIDNEATANAAVFYFDYESPYCYGPDGDNHKSLSGATIRATGGTLDFTLLELLEPIPFNYTPFYAGWDYTGNQPASGIVIHHPYGDVKKVSTEEHKLTETSFGSGYDNNTHWLVSRWESGTTEKGSSGAAFFSQDGRVVGTLTGGLANCTSPVYDYFQMFSHSWADYPSPGSQLACWLDPIDARPGLLDGLDPYSAFRETGDTLSNILDNETLSTESPGLSWGSYSGHNSRQVTGFAERFTANENKNVVGILLDVAENQVADDASVIHLTLWEGNDTPEGIVYEKTVYLADLSQHALSFIEFDSVIGMNPTFFAGYRLEYHDPQDTFSVYMAENRISQPFHTAYVFDDNYWSPLADYTEESIHTSFGIYPVVFDSVPENPYTRLISEHVVAYPSPANQQLWIEFSEISPYPVQVNVYSMEGNSVFKGNYGPYQHILQVDLGNFTSGIYLIQIREGNLIHNLKVAVMK